jgi:uncharacterized membrane protein
MIPPFLPFKSLINIVSGLAEIFLAVLLLFPQYRALAAWGVIVLLICVFPANIYMHIRDQTTATLIRLPMQGLLIWWAHVYTK